MTKVQRLVQKQHDQWYADRRDLYQTLLTQATTANTNSSQQGIMNFVRPAGTFTPPVPQPPIPGERAMRRAHLIMEMEKMPDYRATVLSVTGEILSIDGTKQVSTDCIVTVIINRLVLVVKSLLSVKTFNLMYGN